MADNDIAKLGFSVDSTQVDKATTSLDKMADSSVKAAAASKRLDDAFSSRARALNADTAAGSQASKVSQQLTKDILDTEHATKLSTFQLANLSFQINDIAVGLASGQNPFRLLYQQGAQIAQIFGPSVGVGAALKLVGGAITQFLLNPLNIAVLAFAAGGLVIDQFFKLIHVGGEEAENTLKRNEDLVKRLKQAYEDLKTSGVSAFTEPAREFESRMGKQELQQQLIGQSRSVMQSLIAGSLPISSDDFRAFRDIADQFIEQVKQGRGDVAAFREEIQQIANLDPTNSALQRAAKILMDVTNAAAITDKTLRDLNSAMNSGAFFAEQYAAGLAKISQNVPVLQQAMKLEDLRKTYEGALTALRSTGDSPSERRLLEEDLTAKYQAAIPYITGAANAFDQATTSVHNFIVEGNRADLEPLEKSIQAVRDRADEMKKSLQEALGKEGLTLAQKDTLNGLINQVDSSANAQIAGLRRTAATRAGQKADRAEDRLFGSIEDQVRSLRLQADTFNMTKSAAAAYRVEQDALAEAAQRGISLDRNQLAYLHQLSTAYGDLTYQIERMNNAKEAGQFLASSLLDAVENADSLADALRRVTLALVEAAAQGALLGQGPFAGIFGTKDSGGFLGGIGTGIAGLLGGFLGGFDSGGVIPRGSSGYTGETGIEKITVTGRGAIVTPISSRAKRPSNDNAPNININVNVVGATGNEEVRRMVDVGVANGVSRGLSAYDKALPARLQTYNVEKQ